MGRFLWYIAKRLLNYLVMVFVATSFTFFLASAFMSPRSNFESRTPRPTQESIEASLYRTNLNDKTPVWERYTTWLHGVLTEFDWGMTPNGDSVNREISSRIGASVELMTLGTVLSIVIGVSLGVYTAQRQYQWQDRVFSGVASVFMVIPTVVLAILIVFFAIEINLPIPEVHIGIFKEFHKLRSFNASGVRPNHLKTNRSIHCAGVYIVNTIILGKYLGDCTLSCSTGTINSNSQ